MIKKTIIFLAMVMLTIVCNVNYSNAYTGNYNVSVPVFNEHDRAFYFDTVTIFYDINDLKDVKSDLKCYRKLVCDMDNYSKMNAGPNVKVREIYRINNSWGIDTDNLYNIVDTVRMNKKVFDESNVINDELRFNK